MQFIDLSINNYYIIINYIDHSEDEIIFNKIINQLSEFSKTEIPQAQISEISFKKIINQFSEFSKSENSTDISTLISKIYSKKYCIRLFDLLNKQAMLIDNKNHLEWLMLITEKLSIEENIPENRHKTIKLSYINNDLTCIVQKLISTLKEINYIEVNPNKFECQGYKEIKSIHESFSIPYIKIQLKNDKIEIESNFKKFNHFQALYCDLIHNQISNNNILANINIKSYLLNIPVEVVEKRKYCKVNSSNINRINISFSNEFEEYLKNLSLKYNLTLHFKKV